MKIAEATRGDRSAAPFVRGAKPVDVFDKTDEQLFRSGKVDLLPPADELLAKFDLHSALKELGIVRQGIAENPADINRKTNVKFGDRWKVGEGVFSLTPAELKKLGLPPPETSIVRRYHDLQDLDRYWIAANPSRRLIYSTKTTWPRLESFPKLAQHLGRFRPIMEKRRETRKGSNRWWHLHWPRKEEIWEAPKIMAMQMARRPSFVASSSPVYVPFSVNVFVPADDVEEDLSYLVGVLNSRPGWFWFQHHAKRRGVGLEINGGVLERFPMPRIDFRKPDLVAAHRAIAERAEAMIELHAERRKAGPTHEATLLDRRIEVIDGELDELVASLYGLDEAQVAAVRIATVAEMTEEEAA